MSAYRRLLTAAVVILAMVGTFLSTGAARAQAVRPRVSRRRLLPVLAAFPGMVHVHHATHHMRRHVSRFHPLTPRQYRVRAGDTLSGLAQRFFGDAARWRVIYDQNRNVISNPNDIRVGQVLRIVGATRWHRAVSHRPHGDSDHGRYDGDEARPVTHSASPSAVPLTTACRPTGSGGLLPQNYAAIVDFLVANGYTDNAAAGIAGNIYRESLGNPSAVGTGGGGLIGFTPFVPGQDGYLGNLMSQLEAVLRYNNQYGGAADVNAHAGTPAGAAYYYMLQYERPGIPAAGIREQSAADVAAACGF